MSILHGLVLGALQGIAEFLPISSSGHLIIFPWMLGWDDFGDNESLQRAFDVSLHLGTFFSLLYYFRLEIYKILKEKQIDFILKIALASVPAAVVGVLLFDESSSERIWLIAVFLIAFGVLLGLVDYYQKSSRDISDFQFRDAVIMGLAQAGSLWPGVSRSGIIITAGRASGFSRTAAVNISFWMAMPILLGAGIYKFIDIGGVSGIPSNMRPSFLAGFLVSALVGYFTLKGLIKLVQKLSLLPIVAERIVFGFIALMFLASSFR